MSLIYFLALVGVALVVMTVMTDAVLSVSRKPKWVLAEKMITEVITVEQRTRNLPYVGAERRTSTTQREDVEQLKKVA